MSPSSHLFIYPNSPSLNEISDGVKTGIISMRRETEGPKNYERPFQTLTCVKFPLLEHFMQLLQEREGPSGKLILKEPLGYLEGQEVGNVMKLEFCNQNY